MYNNTLCKLVDIVHMRRVASGDVLHYIGHSGAQSFFLYIEASWTHRNLRSSRKIISVLRKKKVKHLHVFVCLCDSSYTFRDPAMWSVYIMKRATKKKQKKTRTFQNEKKKKIVANQNIKIQISYIRS